MEAKAVGRQWTPDLLYQLMRFAPSLNPIAPTFGDLILEAVARIDHLNDELVRMIEQRLLEGRENEAKLTALRDENGRLMKALEEIAEFEPDPLGVDPHVQIASYAKRTARGALAALPKEVLS